MDNLVELIKKTALKTISPLIPEYRLGTVIDTNPLTVQLDGEDKQLLGSPKTYMPLERNDRVEIRIFGKDAVVVQRIGGDLPTGTILMWSQTSTPIGYLCCDGSEYSKADYPKLGQMLGRLYGGSTGKFRVPDLRGRVPVGIDPNDSQLNTLGKKDGEKTHTLSVGEMPNHDHDLAGYSVLWGQSSQNVQFIVDSSYVQAISSGTVGNGVGANQSSWNKTGTTGGGEAHNNMQPYMTVNFVIKAV